MLRVYMRHPVNLWKNDTSSQGQGGFEELTVSAGSIDTTHAKSGFEYRFQRQ